MEKRYTERFHEKLDLHQTETLDLTFDERSEGTVELFFREDLESLNLHIQADRTVL